MALSVDRVRYRIRVLHLGQGAGDRGSFGQYPPFADRHDRKTLRRLAIHYFLSGEILYRRSFDSTLLRCIDEHESRRLMEEVHGGNCGPHMNCLMLAKKIMRLGYYWSTMETDCVKHVKHCHRCQVYADQIKAPPNELRPMTAPWPFSMWGMDVIGLINPKASNGHIFILVAIDYFTNATNKEWLAPSTQESATGRPRFEESPTRHAELSREVLVQIRRSLRRQRGFLWRSGHFE
ncbi:hypothetical protein CRG98_033399 [Punica granatum]|uniref:Integrase zinc-binding domain-containing protein n=1 Tax=Punica granatum TaxID=22663 RepID=A0A2I0IRB1_PUNGR|nr:hypothetical protein CRG98_033399 [Punica granatum]